MAFLIYQAAIQILGDQGAVANAQTIWCQIQERRSLFVPVATSRNILLHPKTAAFAEGEAHRRKGRVCERFVVALPAEATPEQREALTRAYAEQLSKGMAEAMARLEEADRQRADMQQTIAELEVNAPTIYVEGRSDYIVLNALIAAMNIAEGTLISIATPPRRAGANYVANMLRAWECETKHLDGERYRAIGFVDCDDEGERAFEQFSNELRRPKFVKLLKLPLSEIVTEAHNLGLQFSNCLEELFPQAWWAHARDQDWLGERDRDSILSHTALIEIANERATRDGLYVGMDWELHTTYCVLEEHKVEFANWVATLDADELLAGLSVLSDVLREELVRMGVQFVQPEPVE